LDNCVFATGHNIHYWWLLVLFSLAVDQ